MSLSIAPLSVILPCRNGAATLAEAMDSVFAQTAQPAELLLIDDGCTDDSVKIARSFGPSVRVLRNPRRGLGAAKKLGVEQARGTYIAFIDADDVIEPVKHERQLAVLESSEPYTIVHTGSRVEWTDASRPPYIRRNTSLATGRCTRVLFERNPVCGSSVMMDRSLALELGNYNPELRACEDLGMSLIASVYCNFVCVPEPLYRIRQHGKNMTRRRARMAYYHWLAQERFRQRCPQAFAELPIQTVRECMVEPVLHAAREAYWSRCGDSYRRLLGLAHRLAPHESDLQQFWSRRWIPMPALRAWDRVHSVFRSPPAEVS